MSCNFSCLRKNAVLVFAMSLLPSIALAQAKQAPDAERYAAYHAVLGTLKYSYTSTYADSSISIRVRGPISKTESKTGVLVVKRFGQPARELQLPDDVGMVKSISKVSGDLYFIMEGSEAPYAGGVLVDTRSMTIERQFAFYDPVLSPDHRYLAFARFYPAHFVEDPVELSNFEMVYDFSKGFSFNTTKSVGNRFGEPGYLVYPRSLDLPALQTDPPVTLTHSFAGAAIFSPDSSKLLLLDQRYPVDPLGGRAEDGNVHRPPEISLKAELTYVLVDLSGDHPVTKILRGPYCPDSAGDDCSISLMTASFGPQAVRVSLRVPNNPGSDPVFDLRYNSFRPY